MEYVNKRRPVVPAVYSLAKSGGRQFKDTHLLTELEYNNAVKSNFSAMNVRFKVKAEKFCDELSELRSRITAFNTKQNDGLEGLDDEDIDFLQEIVDDSDSDSDIEFEAILPKPQLIIVKTEENIVDNGAQANETQSTEDNGNGGSNSLDSFEEEDALSATMPFTTNDFKDRYYQAFDVSIRAAIVECLIGWNTTRPFSTVIYDKRFVGVLLKEVFTEEMGQENSNDERLDFIKRLFEIRIKGDEIRANGFDSIVAEKRCKAKNKATRSRVNSIE